VVVQTWNVYLDSSNIAPSLQDGYLYNNINVEKANQFKGTNKKWIDCEIDEECYIQGVQKRCINSTCVLSETPYGESNITGGFNQQSENCNPVWQCTIWSSCTNNLRLRLCEDINDCNKQDTKPSTKETCGETTIAENNLSPLPPVFIFGISVLAILIIALLIVFIHTKNNSKMNQVQRYIQDALEKGYSKDQIVEKLRNSGYDSDLIALLFKKLEKKK